MTTTMTPPDVSSPRPPGPPWRLGVVHAYAAGRREEVARGLYPANHLWGADYLANHPDFEVTFLPAAGRGWPAALARSVSRGVRGRLGNLAQDVAVWQERRGAGNGFDALYVIHGFPLLTAWRAALGGRGRAPRLVRWVYTRPRPFPWWQGRDLIERAPAVRGHAGYLCLTADAADHYRRVAPGALVRSLDWAADLTLFPGSDAPGEFFFACGRTNRDYPTLLRAAAALPDERFHLLVSPELLRGLAVPANVRVLDGPADAGTDRGVSYPEMVARDYARCHALLIPRREDPHDTCGLTNLLEGLAMGRPVVMTRTGALDIDVEAEGVGLHVAPGTQTLAAARYEVVVSDDGASPTAAALVGERFPWARWQAGPRRGPAANRNAGARAARGAWLVFTDDDCLPAPGWLAAFAARVDAGAPVRVLEGRTDSGGAPVGAFDYVPDNLTGGFLWSCNLAAERAFFLALGGFDEGFPFAHLEDVELRMRLEQGRHPWEWVPAAHVAHPPRPVVPIVQQARMAESHFYLAHRRGIPLADAGFGVTGFLRGRLIWFRHCRGWAERLRLLGRSVVEAGLLAAWAPGWAWRYRRSPRPGGPVGTPQA